MFWYWESIQKVLWPTIFYNWQHAHWEVSWSYKLIITLQYAVNDFSDKLLIGVNINCVYTNRV